MKALITGMNGTLAPVLGRALREAGHDVVPWDRSRVPTGDPEAVSGFIRYERPDWFLHLATGSPDWAGQAARASAETGARFLFTSTVSVYGSSQRGPFTPDDIPKPDEPYGTTKLECERRVRAAHPGALIVRLGWQIGTSAGGNQMVDHLERTFRTDGRIVASARWFPACSFLFDAAGSMVRVMEALPAGLYHLDGNPGLGFLEIVSGLRRMLGAPWIVVPGDEPERNHRMLDERLPVPSITHRLRGGE